MLTNIKIQAAKPREKAYKLTDGDGLVLLIRPNGTRLWRFRYRFGGRENMIALGRYPEISLAEARAKAHECRRMLQRNEDPARVRERDRLAREDTFSELAAEWLSKNKQKFSAHTLRKIEWQLSLLGPLNGRAVREITPMELLRELRKIEERGHHDTAHRVLQRVSQVYRYGVAAGRADRDIAADIRGALAPVISEHRAALTNPTQVGELLRAIDGYQGQPSVMYALRLAPILFVRPGELRGAQWAEFDLEAAEWRIPGERMKMDDPHIVPLPRQAIALLEELKMFTSYSRFLFPSLRSKDRPISDTALNAALRRLGYSKEEQTSHGFRTIASTLLNELGFDPDVIERQLAHVERNKVRAAYNRAMYLAERRTMMQAWADYLDGLRSGARVVPIRSGRGE
jgi:integrase